MKSTKLYVHIGAIALTVALLLFLAIMVTNADTLEPTPGGDAGSYLLPGETISLSADAASPTSLTAYGLQSQSPPQTSAQAASVPPSTAQDAQAQSLARSEPERISNPRTGIGQFLPVLYTLLYVTLLIEILAASISSTRRKK